MPRENHPVHVGDGAAGGEDALAVSEAEKIPAKFIFGIDSKKNNTTLFHRICDPLNISSPTYCRLIGLTWVH